MSKKTVKPKDWVIRRREYHAKLKQRYELKKANQGIRATY